MPLHRGVLGHSGSFTAKRRGQARVSRLPKGSGGLNRVKATVSLREIEPVPVP